VGRPPCRLVQLLLGVDSAFRPSDLGAPDNVLPPVIQQVKGFALLSRFSRTAVFRTLVAPYVPRAVRSFGSNLVARRPVRPADVDASEVAAFLRSAQQRETDELGRILIRTLPEWGTLYARTA
jgi:hypothetical protein